MSHQALPPIAGWEAQLQALRQHAGPVAPSWTTWRLEAMKSAFACALHMHQPTIPAGGQGELISHLPFMVDHPGEGDNHNAELFAQCYKRIAYNTATVDR